MRKGSIIILSVMNCEKESFNIGTTDYRGGSDDISHAFGERGDQGIEALWASDHSFGISVYGAFVVARGKQYFCGSQQETQGTSRLRFQYAPCGSDTFVDGMAVWISRGNTCGRRGI